VSPLPDAEHGFTIAALDGVLRAALPAELAVLSSTVGVDLAPSYRIPDLVVVRRDLRAKRRKHLVPEDLVLVVEVVSPSSVSTDRLAKPAEYARAGIGVYWRVETDPQLSLTAYVLRAGARVYTELGTWLPGQTARLQEPFPIDVVIDRLAQ
jgi:Uma2 family endonuclease